MGGREGNLEETRLILLRFGMTGPDWLAPTPVPPNVRFGTTGGPGLGSIS